MRECESMKPGSKRGSGNNRRRRASPACQLRVVCRLLCLDVSNRSCLASPADELPFFPFFLFFLPILSTRYTRLCLPFPPLLLLIALPLPLLRVFVSSKRGQRAGCVCAVTKRTREVEGEIEFCLQQRLCLEEGSGTSPAGEGEREERKFLCPEPHSHPLFSLSGARTCTSLSSDSWMQEEEEGAPEGGKGKAAERGWLTLQEHVLQESQRGLANL